MQLNKMNKTTLLSESVVFCCLISICITTNNLRYKSLYNRYNIDLSIFYESPPKNEQNKLYDS